MKRPSASKFDCPGRRASCTSGMSASVATPKITDKVRHAIDATRKPSLEDSTKLVPELGPRINNSFLKKALRNQNSETAAKPARTKSVPGIPAGDSVWAGGLPCRYCA